MLETIDSEKIAIALNRALNEKNASDPMNVFVQVNTSQETSKTNVDCD